jgi:excisionase family DNA binding protein
MGPGPGNTKAGSSGFPQELPAFTSERRTGFEPATPSLGSAAPTRPAVISRSQALGTLGGLEPGPVQPSQPVAGSTKAFAAPVLQGPAPTRRLRVLPGGAERLLTVREVAERLGVCTATVYGLCTRGELPHLRVSNAIRIRPTDLDAFLTRGLR